MAKKKKDKKDKPNIHIEGGVHAGRDTVFGDKTEYNYNYGTPPDEIKTREEFISELENLKAELKQLRKSGVVPEAQQDQLKTAEGNVKKALKESQKDKPAADNIKSHLDTAKAMLELVGSGVDVAAKIATVVTPLAALALKLFVG